MAPMSDQDPPEMNAAHLTADGALDRAAKLALLGPAYGPNPQVGCVITDAQERVLAEGYHRGAGTAHAEVDALSQLEATPQERASATAYVTLEPCNHTGRTGPCAQALREAGIGRVVYAVPDPNPQATGGAEALRSWGVAVEHRANEAAADVTRRWRASISLGRPYVIAKWATTLDGRVAAADGTSFWITGEQARDHAHGVRAQVDAILVGTGTVRIDDPQLSARPVGVSDPHQPLRVVLGNTPTDGAQVWRDDNALWVPSRDPRKALDALQERGARTLVVEGGPTVVSAFLAAGLVDEINVYVAPMLLGDGRAAVDGLGIGTMALALRGESVTQIPLGADTLISALLTKGS
jgi:diaminohydroxyphosphoribosylaminopyrimidine deaminase/5-amino-6-(5-phosphoribosylamino)uracil reductase